jgi:hypothetical protein
MFAVSVLSTFIGIVAVSFECELAALVFLDVTAEGSHGISRGGHEGACGEHV